MIGFFVYKKSINLKRKEINYDKYYKTRVRNGKTLKKKIEFICEFSNITLKIINESIRKVDKTYLSYIDPHRIITFLAFNYEISIYIEKLSKSILIKDLEKFIKT